MPENPKVVVVGGGAAGLAADGLFLAGDYMQMPCTNGAMRSGIEAAEAAAFLRNGG